MPLVSQVESLLFVATKPLSAQKLASLTGAPEAAVQQAIVELQQQCAQRGLQLLQMGNSYQLATRPEHAELVREFLHDEQTGELTRASLETLAIVAYRGPVTRAEVEQIRGVNCAVIFRHLLIRGLVEATDDPQRLATVYKITFDFLKLLGVSSLEELPDFAKLNSDENLQALLGAAESSAEEQQIS